MRADIHTHKQTTIVLEDSASITTSQTMADFAKGRATASWQTKVANLPCASETERANPAERTAGRRALFDLLRGQVARSQEAVAVCTTTTQDEFIFDRAQNIRLGHGPIFLGANSRPLGICD
ncbi:MAG: hypothetical protein AAF754_16160 [Pseudomonadota bacterium]